jgi:hypothetical protein
MPDILKAVHDYVIQYTDTPPAIIYRGYQNRAALPAGRPDFCLIALVSSARHGSNAGELTADEAGQVTVRSLREYAVSVDFTHYDQATAAERGGRLETLSRSPRSVSFFAGYDIAFLHADELQYLPYVDDADQFLHRYRLTLRLSVWEAVTLSAEHFTQVEFTRIENIDVHHPPAAGGLPL